MAVYFLVLRNFSVGTCAHQNATQMTANTGLQSVTIRALCCVPDPIPVPAAAPSHVARVDIRRSSLFRVVTLMRFGGESKSVELGFILVKHKPLQP